MRFRTFALAIAVVALLAPAAYAQDPVGVWKANIAKSKFSPGPAPKSITITTTAVGDGSFKTVNETVPATGAPTRTEVSYKFDGKDNKMTGNPNADTQSYTKVNDRQWTVVAKKGDKVSLMSKVSMAADGKTRTTSQTGTDAQGRRVSNTIVYEKQ